MLFLFLLLLQTSVSYTCFHFRLWDDLQLRTDSPVGLDHPFGFTKLISSIYYGEWHSLSEENPIDNFENDHGIFFIYSTLLEGENSIIFAFYDGMVTDRAIIHSSVTTNNYSHFDPSQWNYLLYKGV
mgnify:CR=1 FL=1